MRAMSRKGVTLGRLILALAKFCDVEIFRFSVYFNLANSWKISELEKMVSDMVFSECDSTCILIKKSHNCMKILYLVSPQVILSATAWVNISSFFKTACGTNFPVV